MAKIELDFIRRPGGVSWIGAPLLLAGLGLVVMATMRLAELDAQQERITGQMWKLQAPAETSPSSDAPEALAAADKLARQFRRPWGALFVRLEKIEVKGVRLSQILPQTGNNPGVQLGGEAENNTALYDYLRRLRQEGGLRDVHLIQQNTEENAKGIKFLAQARWSEGQIATEPTP